MEKILTEEERAAIAEAIQDNFNEDPIEGLVEGGEIENVSNEN